jgi:hypothetical protein
VARAGDQSETFAHFFQVDPKTVDDVRGFELPKAAGYTHLLVGRFATSGAHRQNGAVFMRCDARQCTGTRVYLEVNAELHVIGVVDLSGAPTALRTTNELRRASRLYAPIARIGAGKRLSRPAVVFETRRSEVRTGSTRWRKEVTGTERRHHLIIVPLRAGKDERLHRVFRETTVDRGLSGAGTTTSYRLERGKTKRALDIVATEQRHLDNLSMCLRPDPTEHRFVLKDGRYQRDLGLDLPGGCR